MSDLGFPGKTQVLVVGFFSSLGVDRRWFWSDFSQARPESGLFGSIRSIENLVENPGFVQFPGFISRTQVFRSRLLPGCGCSQVDFGGARVTPSGHGQHPCLVFVHVYTLSLKQRNFLCPLGKDDRCPLALGPRERLE